jgi:hypothetical protein
LTESPAAAMARRRRVIIGRWSGRWGLFADGPGRSRVA